MKKFLLLANMIIGVLAGYAQQPTTVSTSTDCTVFRNFNSSNENFSSPSIYSDANDVSFFWDSGTGSEIENSGLFIRNASLVSPIYFNAAPGQTTVGFSYTCPANTQYRVRVISGVIGSPLEVLATTANGPVFTNLPGTSGNICLSLTDADLLAGAAVRFEFTFRAIGFGTISFDNLALSVAAGPLPVNFIGFVARKNDNNTVKLLWNVADEINVRGYYLESSVNGVDFTNAGYVPATGNANYSFDYQSRLTQNMFFRVKNVDIDNRSKYTPIIRVYVNDLPGMPMIVYPVPATSGITVQHEKSFERSVISLINLEGQVVKQVVAIPNTLQTQLDISNLVDGIYVIRYDDGHGQIQSMKMIKN